MAETPAVDLDAIRAKLDRRMPAKGCAHCHRVVSRWPHQPWCMVGAAAALLGMVDTLTAERDALREAILDIDAHSTPLAVDDDGFVAGGYLISIGCLHRALGLVGHPAAKCGFCAAESHDCAALASTSPVCANCGEAIERTADPLDRWRHRSDTPGALGSVFCHDGVSARPALAGTSPTPPTRDLAALADEWERRSTALFVNAGGDGFEMGKAGGYKSAASDLRAALGGAPTTEPEWPRMCMKCGWPTADDGASARRCTYEHDPAWADPDTTGGDA